MNSTFMNQTTTCVYREDSEWAKIVKTLAYCVMLLLALGGNILLVSVVWTQKKLRTTTNVLISNMAVSDLLVPVFAMPRTIVEIHFGFRRWLVTGTTGLALCKLVYFLQDVSTAVSVLSLSVLTVDRFYAVVCPREKPPLRGKIKLVIFTIWAVAMLLHSPYLYTFQLVPLNNLTYCLLVWPPHVNPATAMKAFFLTLITLLYFIPLCIIVLLQGVIVRKIQRTQLPAFTSSFRHRRRAKRNKNILRFTIAVIVLFFACWSPTVIYSFLLLFGNLQIACVLPHFRFTTQFLVQSNSSMNFFIYFIFNESHRTIFKDLFCKRNIFMKRLLKRSGRDAQLGRMRSRMGSPSSYNVSEPNEKGTENGIELKKMQSETFNSEASGAFVTQSFVNEGMPPSPF